jgi:MscS family membrane protein
MPILNLSAIDLNMELIWHEINKIDPSNIPIPIVKVGIAIFLLSLLQFLNQSLVTIVIKNFKRLASKVNIRFNDELALILKPALSYLILVSGLWLVNEFLADDLKLSDELKQLITKILGLIGFFSIAYIIYQASSVLGKSFAHIVLRTGTDLDNLLRPLMPKLFQSIAVILVIIKLSELFLGQSATALVGLLGGAGITLGLIFKEILYDWFCTIIIYLDRLFQEGDWVKVAGTSGSARIISIGFRTTALHMVEGGSILKMPNSKMVAGTVENWSQNVGREVKLGLNLILKLDSVSAEKTAMICDRIQEMPKSIQGCYELSRVRFSKIELNVRTIEILAFVSEEKLYFKAEKQLNLAILELLEHEGVNPFSVKLEVEEGQPS